MKIIDSPNASGSENIQNTLAPDFEHDFLASSLISRGLFNEEREKKVRRRVKQLKVYLDEHYLNTDTTIVDQSANVDLFDEQHRKAKKQGIASFVVFFGSFIPIIGIVFFVASIVFGINSLKNYRKTFDKEGRGLAVASLILSGTVLALLLLLIFLTISFFSQGELI